MKIALTGATGHLGGAIVRELHARQHSIKALVRADAPDIFDGISIEWIRGDLQNKEALSKLMESCDAVIHSAGLISIHGDQGGLVPLTNVVGTRNVMDAAHKAGVKRVVHISSIQAYEQKPSNAILDENRPKTSDNSFAYDRSKRDGENIALSYATDQMEVIVVNPTSIVGPYDFKPSKLGKAIIQIYNRKLPFVLKGGTDYCDVRDVAYAIVNGLTMGKSGESYLLSGKWLSLKNLSQTVGERTGQKIKTTALPPVLAWIGLPFSTLTAWIKNEEPLISREAIIAVTDGNRHISSAKAQKELQYKPRPFDETIKDVCAWFMKNGYLG